MPIADPKTYAQMLDAARAGKFAYPAINVSSSESLNAALRGFVEAKSDGIVQVSTGGGEFASGATVKDGVLGAIALAEFAHIVGERCPVNIALHTDHCHPEKVDTFLRPLLAASRERVAAGKGPLFQSHMYDGSPLPLAENMRVAKELLAECAELDIILEVEADALGTGEKGQYLFAATFGNVHGVYKPGNVVLKPTILRDGQAAVEKKYGEAGRFLLVFHGGSGSALEEIRETLDFGVVKMNVDTDTQYALTRAIADHMFKNYDGVLKIDGEVGVKKVYDPRSYMKAAETSMATRVVEACEDLRSTGTTLRK